MRAFTFKQATGQEEALLLSEAHAGASPGNVRFIAGGTTLVDLMKLNVERPSVVIDINRLPLNRIEVTPDDGVHIGALVRNGDCAHHPLIQSRYPALSQALLSGASAQLRNMATTGGNLLQRTRCMYYRDTVWPCNKRVPGSGCSAIGGANRMLAILGASEHCIATNPSDMNVALTALEATVHLQGRQGERSIAIGEFFRRPGTTPHIENVMQPGELITAVTLPATAAGSRSLYIKLRDRATYEFALASAAVVLTTVSGRITHVRLALGGVGTVPWRAHEAEAALLGKVPSPAIFRRAAEAALQHARPQSENGFKVELARRCITHALTTAAAGGGEQYGS